MRTSLSSSCYAKLITLMMCVMVTFAAFTSATHAANNEDTSGRKTRKAPAMTERVYKKLTEAQELIEKNKYKDGLAVLNDLLQDTHLSDYERAQTYNYFAYTYFTMERYEDAIRAYENVLKQPNLPEALEQNSVYTLAQLYFIKENYAKAIEIINKWFKLVDKPTENAYMLLGQAYYQLEKYKDSLVPLKEAYKMVKDRGDKPKENLLLLLRVDYFNLGDYKNMIAVLDELLHLYPKPEYWKTLAGAYSEMKRLDKQMSIFEALYEAGELSRGNEQLNLANLYLLYEVPYKSAVLLDKGIKSGLIEKNVRNLRLLSQAWLQSQESKKSIEPLIEASKLSSDGDVDITLAQAYINTDDYKDAVGALNSGLKKGGLKRTDQAFIMLGMSLFETKKYSASIEAFREAAKDKRSRKTAESWIKYVASERDRERQLAESLKDRRGS